jgi:SAM-dependent methyltransferase
VFADGLSYARARFGRPNVEFRQHDIASDELLGTDGFDVIACFEVIEHVEHPVELLKGIARQLRADGVLYLSTPNGPVVTSPDGVLSDPTHVREYSASEIGALLARAGLEEDERFGQRHAPAAIAAQNERARAARLDVLGLRRAIPERLRGRLSIWWVRRRLGADPSEARSTIDADWRTAPILLFSARHAGASSDTG